MSQSSSLDAELRSFFRAIKEHPEDDTPRLIFADWLQERGDAATLARGEFLRLTVLRHRLSPDDPSYDLLKRREGELLTEHRWTWLGPLVDAARSWTFERGMIQITAQAEKLATPEVATWIRTEAALWIDTLRLPELIYEFRDEAACQTMHRAYSPLLASVNCLDLSTGPTHRRFFIALGLIFRELSAHNLPFLTQLVLSHIGLSRRLVLSLTRCQLFHRLKLLDLQHNRLDDAAARLLSQSVHLRNLATLRVGGNRFTAKAIALLRDAFGERVHF